MRRPGEEWRSDINETPGEIGKLFNALSLLSAPSRMPKLVTTSQPFDEPMQEKTAIKAEIEALPPVGWMNYTTMASHYHRRHRGAAICADNTGWMAYAAMQGVPSGETPI